MRHRKTDAHIATVRVSVPIAAMDAATVQAAAEAIAEIVDNLPPGSMVEVLNSRFGRMDAPIRTVAEVAVTGEVTGTAITDAMAEIKTQLAPAGEPEIPASLRRIA